MVTNLRLVQSRSDVGRRVSADLSEVGKQLIAFVDSGLPLDFDRHNGSIARDRDGLKICGNAGHCGWRKYNEAVDV